MITIITTYLSLTRTIHNWNYYRVFLKGVKKQEMFLGDFHSIAEPLRRSWTTTRLFESMVLQKTKSCSRKLQNAMKKTGQGCQTPVYILGGAGAQTSKIMVWYNHSTMVLQKNQELFKEVIECNKSFINCRKKLYLQWK